MVKLLFYYDYIGGICGKKPTRNPEFYAQGEGVDVDEWPTGWRTVDGAPDNYTGCEITRNWPGLDTTSWASHAVVTEQMPKVPQKQFDGEIWRGNELGIIVNNDLFWTEYGIDPASILLGSTVEQHIVIRPILDSIYGGDFASSAATFEASAAAWLASRTGGGLDMSDGGIDVKEWVHIELLKVTFPNTDLSLFTDTREFATFMGTLTGAQTISQLISDSLSSGLSGIGDMTILQTLALLAETWRPLVEAEYGEQLDGYDCSPSTSCVHQLTAALLDTFLFAGGLSVPSAINAATWVLYADTHPYTTTLPHGETMQIFPTNYVYDRADPLPFVWEAIRFFPPVLGFPWWIKSPEIASCPFDCGQLEYTECKPQLECSQMAGGVREVMLLGMAQRDPNAWGETAGVFRVRPIGDYANSVGFAEHAVDNSVANGAMNRNCPAKQLALQLASAWFRAFDQSAYCLEDPTSTTFRLVTAPSPFVTEFTLTACTAEA